MFRLYARIVWHTSKKKITPYYSSIFTKNNILIIGASNEIGREIALAKYGCILALIETNQHRLEEILSLLAEFGSASSIHICDVSNASTVTFLAADICRHY